MNSIFLYFISLLFASYFCFKITYKILHHFNLYSYPTSRGLHKSPIITSGGIFFIFYLLLLFLIKKENFYNESIYNSLILLAFVIMLGLFDDKYNFSRKYKLFIQIIVSITIVKLFEFRIIEIFFSLVDTNILIILVNIFLIIAFINFINFIDGTDGNLILFNLFIFISLLIKIFLLKIFNEYVHILYFIPFLVVLYFYNMKKKIFLGDSGSFFLSIFLILNFNYF